MLRERVAWVLAGCLLVILLLVLFWDVQRMAKVDALIAEQQNLDREVRIWRAYTIDLWGLMMKAGFDPPPLPEEVEDAESP